MSFTYAYNYNKTTKPKHSNLTNNPLQAMQVIWVLVLQHPLAAVIHEVTHRYVGQIQDSSLSCFAVPHIELLNNM